MYKIENESPFAPNRIKLVIDPFTDVIEKSDLFNEFLSNLELFQSCLTKSINYAQVHMILESFTRFIYYFPEKIKEYFSEDLCQQIQSFINEEVVYAKEIKIVEDSMTLISYLCSFELEYISFFSDNQIIDQAINVYLKSTHELFKPTTRLLRSLLVQNTSQATSLICKYLFPAANDYCYALLKGIDKERENIRVATSFFYFLTKYPPSLTSEHISRIFEVVKFQIEWNEQSTLPNNIFVFTLWTYESLLQNYSSKINIFITPRLIKSISQLLEDDFVENVNNQECNDDFYDCFNLEMNPQRPLLSIYYKLFNAHFALFPQFIESISFPRLMLLTKSNDSNVALESFGILKTIIIHHFDLVNNLIAFDLFNCLKEGFENTFQLKSAAYKCVYELLRSRTASFIYQTFLNEVFFLTIEYVSTMSQGSRKNFLEVVLEALRIIMQQGWVKDVTNYLANNNSSDLFEEIFEDQPYELVIQIKNVLFPKAK